MWVLTPVPLPPFLLIAAKYVWLQKTNFCKYARIWISPACNAVLFSEIKTKFTQKWTMLIKFREMVMKVVFPHVVFHIQVPSIRQHKRFNHNVTWNIVLRSCRLFFLHWNQRNWKKPSVMCRITLFYTPDLETVVFYVMVLQPYELPLCFLKQVWQLNHTRGLFQMGAGNAAIHIQSGLTLKVYCRIICVMVSVSYI